MIEIDLINDFENFLRSQILNTSNILQEIKYESQLEEIEDVDELCRLYLNLRRRLIEPRSRKIVKSNEFNCPSHLEENLDELEEKITQGEDLTPFLSRELRRLNFPDATLNEWGIHHLHLGGFKAPDQFSDGLNEILFAWITHDKIYFIQIMTHSDWTNRDLIQIIHDNWPNLIAQFRIGQYFEKISDEDRIKWRRGGVSTSITMDDGTTYRGPGIINVNLFNIFDVRDCSYLINNIENMEQKVIHLENEIKSKIMQIYNVSREKLDLKLVEINFIDEELEFIIKELNTGLNIALKGNYVIYYKL